MKCDAREPPPESDSPMVLAGAATGGGVVTPPRTSIAVSIPVRCEANSRFWNAKAPSSGCGSAACPTITMS